MVEGFYVILPGGENASDDEWVRYTKKGRSVKRPKVTFHLLPYEYRSLG